MADREWRDKRPIRAARKDSDRMGRKSRAAASTTGRATVAAAADRHAADLAQRLGASLKYARGVARLTQAAAAGRAGISQGTWSSLEIDRDGRYTLATWDRAAFAVGTRLDAFLPQATAANQPRDAVHLKNQELVIRMSRPGGWGALPEELIDREARTSRAADVLLYRRRIREPAEYALMEVIDWFDDVGAPIRDWSRRLDAVERFAIARMAGDDPLPRTSGCWIVRATRRNRRLIGDHVNFFRARFPGSGHAWIAALTDANTAMPKEPALLWVTVDGTRLFPARLRG
jgi:transcriptional regulator with XRE-family HTH domain